MISPRAVALQGIGFAALSIAVQGFTPVVQPPQPPTPVVSGGLVSGGHARFETRPYKARDRGDEKRRIEEDNLVIMAVIKKFLDDST